MEINEMISRYNIKLPTEAQIASGQVRKGNICIYGITRVKAENAQPMIQANKDAIIAELHRRAAKAEAKEAAERKAAIERQQKIDAIEGLTEIKAARAAWSRYRWEFNRMMDDESNDGAFPPVMPKVKPEDLIKQYPEAAAYLKAESYEFSDHYAQSAAGRKAIDRMLAGENAETVLAEMEAEWSAYCKEHMWD